MPRTGNCATGYAPRSIPRAGKAQHGPQRRISQTGNSLHLSTVAKSKGSCPSWVKIESAGWVRIQSARTRSVLDEASKLWDLDPSDRFVKLAENYPGLLAYEEQLIWKAIDETTLLISYSDDAGKAKSEIYDFLDPRSNLPSVDRVKVRECWPKLIAYAEGNATLDDLTVALKLTKPF